ncbi:MAG: monofunctional biosynthetic peptidoglycan transglycosylase [Nitrospira sp.]|nr:monofunctional biosynthetic peptidoglycan transglycosylase [Nitrospira sp.]MCP9441713.1 monofunctional biosynthetic peptidoglycan transglycosylase [Nitrospira sp.]
MPKSTHRRLFARLLAWSLLIVGVPSGVLALFWLITLPDVSELAHANPSSTALMEQRLEEIPSHKRPVSRQWVWVPLARISPHLQRAVIAAEDASFFVHDGFDWEGIRDAALHNIEAGEMKRGGSTITQQLAKNLYLSSERSLLRKMREALITRLLERRLTKKRILEIYLNVAEWGRGVYGAEAAARHHFGKSAADLTEDEAAWLAAILPSPRRYDPLRKTAALMQRHQRILRDIRHVSMPAPSRGKPNRP